MKYEQQCRMMQAWTLLGKLIIPTTMQQYLDTNDINNKKVQTLPIKNTSMSNNKNEKKKKKKSK